MDKNSVFYLWGEEAFLIDEEIKRIVSVLQEQSEDDPEILYVDADDLSPRELVETLEFSPLFALQRIVIIKRPHWLGKTKRKSSMSADIHKILTDYLQRDNQGQTLVITSNEHSATNPIVKLLDKNAKVINCKAAGSQYILQWIKEEFARKNCSIKPAAANMLARSGQDMYYLQNLIAKVCLMVEDRVVSESDIEEELNSKEEIKVFKLSDALLNRNLQESFRAYYQLLGQGEYPLVFLRVITRQFITLGKVKSYMEKGLNLKQIAEEIGQKEFAIKKMMEKARNFSWEEIRILFDNLLQADINFKSSGKDKNIIMETLIIEICSKK